MKEEKAKISEWISSPWVAFFVVLPYIKPASEITGSFDILFDIWKALSFLFTFILLYLLKSRLSKGLIYIIIIQLVMLISTFIHNGDIKTAIVQVLSNIGICTYINICYYVDEKAIIRNMCYPTLFMAILTVLSMILYYPNGMYQVIADNYTEVSNYLWGFDNTSGLLMLSTIYFLGLYSLYINKRSFYIVSFTLILSIFGAFYLVDSKTAYILIACYLLIYLGIIFLRKKVSINSPQTLFVFLVLFFFIFLIINDKLTFFWSHLSSIDKYYSVKGRIYIWEAVIHLFSESPLLGHGIERKTQIISNLTLDHPHNVFMDLVYRGGAMAFLVFICFMIELFKKKKTTDVVDQMTYYSMFIVLIAVMFDYYNDVYLFYPQCILSFLILHERKNSSNILSIEGNNSDFKNSNY